MFIARVRGSVPAFPKASSLPLGSRPFTYKPPSRSDIAEIADKWKLGISTTQTPEYEAVLENLIGSFVRCNELWTKHQENIPKPKQRKFWAPLREENPHNAWYQRCDVQETSEGLLKGKTIALKDNVQMASIPMMNGSAVLEGFVPTQDATIVTRILDAGGRIMGKAHCEDLCYSGASFSNHKAPVRNARSRDHDAGGSSSGSAVLVASGVVDMAIAADQGGSIRIPACRNEIFGIKPSFGLVPYSGIFGMERTLDHAGVHARTVHETALLLQAIAGSDGLDPRQIGAPKYRSELTNFASRLDQRLVRNGRPVRIGVLREGFKTPASEPEVDHVVANAIQTLGANGAFIKEVSIPLHLDGVHIWTAVGQGVLTTQFLGAGMGDNTEQMVSPNLAAAFLQGMKQRAHELSPTNKAFLMLGQHMLDNYGMVGYSQGRVLTTILSSTYDKVLDDVDVIVMPTLPQTPCKIPDVKSLSVAEYIDGTLNMTINTASFNLTGHPAMTVPVERARGLPVGMMIVGRKGNDQMVLDVARAWEGIHEI